MEPEWGSETGQTLCPRCSRCIPSDDAPGSAPGVPTLDAPRQAIVCSACAWHEAWLSASGQPLPAAWPVDVPARFYGAIGSC